MVKYGCQSFLAFNADVNKAGSKYGRESITETGRTRWASYFSPSFLEPCWAHSVTEPKDSLSQLEWLMMSSCALSGESCGEFQKPSITLFCCRILNIEIVFQGHTSRSRQYYCKQNSSRGRHRNDHETAGHVRADRPCRCAVRPAHNLPIDLLCFKTVQSIQVLCGDNEC